jgi:hypothetical protein
MGYGSLMEYDLSVLSFLNFETEDSASQSLREARPLGWYIDDDNQFVFMHGDSFNWDLADNRCSLDSNPYSSSNLNDMNGSNTNVTDADTETSFSEDDSLNMKANTNKNEMSQICSGYRETAEFQESILKGHRELISCAVCPDPVSGASAKCCSNCGGRGFTLR